MSLLDYEATLSVYHCTSATLRHRGRPEQLYGLCISDKQKIVLTFVTARDPDCVRWNRINKLFTMNDLREPNPYYTSDLTCSITVFISDIVGTRNLRCSNLYFNSN